MPKNEDGEFELILGNRQLLSVFFIVVMLLGVFFAMGYIVGKNTGPSPTDIASAHKPETKPLVVDSAAKDSPTAPAASTEAPAPAPTGTQPQRPTEPEKTQPEKGAATESVADVPKPEKPSKKEASKPAPQDPAPASGQTYLQLAATAKAEADVMVDALRSKHFKARTMEIPEKPGVYRVLVGPIPEGSLNKTKADLSAVGMPGDKAIKKVF